MKEADATHLAGDYRLDVPDAAIATGVEWCRIAVTISGCYVAKIFIPLGSKVATDLFNQVVTRTGTAQAGTSTTITLDSGASATDNIYGGQVVAIVGGTGAGEEQPIIGYVGSTKVATVPHAWATTPDNTSVFEVRDLVAPAIDSAGRVRLQPSGLDDIVTEVGLNFRQAQSIIAAMAAGVLAGAATTTVTIAAAGVPATNRITATVDVNGNRSAVVLNPPA